MAWKELLERNRKWSAEKTRKDPDFFSRVAGEHRPRVLFLCCSDARVPVNLVTDTDLGEIFVHRNVSNQVHPTDASLSAGLQYAVEVLGVTDVIVCGHHGCGGVRAALDPSLTPDLHHLETWISPLRMLARLHRAELEGLDRDAQVDRLVDLNVAEQLEVLARHPSVRAAWSRGRDLRLHGWVYDLPTGVLQPRLRYDGPDRPHAAEALLSSGVAAQAK